MITEFNPHELLSRLIGRETQVCLHPFQQRTGAALLEGKNVILTAPTGSGKTWAALLPYLSNWKKGKKLWDRVIYALPLRSLASSLWHSTYDACQRAGFPVVAKPPVNLDTLGVTLQIGSSQGDPFFQGHIIFTTIDQLLSGYLHLPVSLPYRLGNINAATTIGSMLVFDEVHLLEPERALATMMELADRVKGLSNLVVMTATLSRDGVETLSRQLKADVVKVAPEELTSLPSHGNKERSYQFVGEPITAAHVLDKHRNQSIVVVNSVARAQRLFRDIEWELRARKIEDVLVLLLHSRFYPEDRKCWEEQVIRIFGPDGGKESTILVATQVVEAGLDLSADDLHTELCPANSLIQRAGRCARFAAPRNVGTVWVYALEKTEGGQDRFGPYRNQAPFLKNTKSILQESFVGRPLTFKDEDDLVDAVHGSEEKQMLQRVIVNLAETRELVNNTMENGDPGLLHSLVRAIDSVSLVVHGHPECLDLNLPYSYLSVPRHSLWGLKNYFAHKSQPWVAVIPVEAGEEETIQVQWQPVINVQEAMRTWLLVLHPSIASYDTRLGLELGVSGNDVLPPLTSRDRLYIKGYQCETYSQHVQRTKAALFQEIDRYQISFECVANRLGVPADVVREMAFVTASFHDVGKLSSKWQSAITAWQGDFYHQDPFFSCGEPLAHSTINFAKDVAKLDNLRYKRPPHAAEGAYAVMHEVYTWLKDKVSEEVAGQLTKVVTTAIARHHSPKTHDLHFFNLQNDAVMEVSKTIDWSDKMALLSERPDRSACMKFHRYLVQYNFTADEPYLLLYWLLVRLLRLADQKATAQASA